MCPSLIPSTGNQDCIKALDMTNVIDDNDDSPDAVMKVRLVRRMTSKAPINAAEYA